MKRTVWVATGIAIALCSMFWGYVAYAADGLPWFMPAIVAASFAVMIWVWCRLQAHITP